MVRTIVSNLAHATLLTLLLSVSTATAAQNPGHSDNDEAAIRRLDSQDALAAQHNDVDVLISQWTDDGVLLQPFSPPVVGKAALKRLFDAQKKQSSQMQISAYDENWKECHIAGEKAYEWGTITITAKLPDQNTVQQTVTALRILTRQADGSWKFSRVAISPGPKGSGAAPAP